MLAIESHGVRIPALGFGTFRLDGRAARRMVGYALEIGYRHIDTAQMYGNEAEVGEAIAASAVPRAEIWLTTKIWPDNFRDGALQRAAEQSVRRLGTEPDLLLLHWPNPNVPRAETIRALNDARRRGLTGHIGISNSPAALIREVGGGERGAAVGQPGRVSSLSQPARRARGAARQRHGAHRLFAGRPGQGVRRAGARGGSASATARTRARWRSAGCSSRTASARSRAPRARPTPRPISRSSILPCPTPRWPRSQPSPAPAAGSSTPAAWRPPGIVEKTGLSACFWNKGSDGPALLLLSLGAATVAPAQSL